MPIALSLCALFFEASFAWKYTVNTPCSDGWFFVGLHEKRVAGTLAFSDLFVMHNEHLYFFPSLLFVGLGAITGLNLRAEALVSQVELLLMLVVVYCAARRQFGFRRFSVPWWFVPVPFLIFNLSQWRNLLCGFQTGFILSVPFSLLAYYALGRSRLAWFLLALVSATIASFSTAMGLAVWPAGVLVLVSSRARTSLVGVWAAVGAGEWLTYFAYYRVSAGHTHQVERVFSEFGRTFGGVTSFFVVLLGNPLSSSLVEGAVVGAFALLSLGACVYALIRAGRIRDNSMWLACVAQVLFTCLMISIGRSVLGIEYARESRYNTHIVPFLVGLLMLAASVATSPKFQGGRVLGRAVFGMLLALVVLGTVPALVLTPKLGAENKLEAEDYLWETYLGNTANSRLLQRWEGAGFDVDPALER